MKTKVAVVLLAGVLFAVGALVPGVSEGRGGNGGGRRCGQGQQQCRQVNPNCAQDRQRLRDGSCGNASCPQNGSCPNQPQGTSAPPSDQK